ncbi:MAG: ATP-dependent zinc metalloprotease FtsH [Chitinophagaceae bacterium]|nr:ATP-dependent zinc metalloprotease FtsH [Chitinophagaceae bacterium]
MKIDIMKSTKKKIEKIDQEIIKNKNKIKDPTKDKKGEDKKINYQMWIIIGSTVLLMIVTYLGNNKATITITQKRFGEMYQENHIQELILIKNEDVVEVVLKEEALEIPTYKKELSDNFNGFGKKGPHYKFKISSLDKFLDQLKKIEEQIPDHLEVPYKIEERANSVEIFFNYGFIILLIFGFWYMIKKMTSMGGPGGQLFSIGKSKASLFDGNNKVKITFEDVAGLEEAKEEVKEIVDFLKSPDKYTNLGGKIPKGALLIGPPGTGKTLLAKAVAGEANVPFFSLSGSDFVEMFVGVGSSRVRDLFKQAKEKAPCIIFIDEIDAIGRTRGRNHFAGGSNDERENTLNSLLVEMDGFGNNAGIIILAATNRPDVLDSALLRPGRFDRQISIDKPDLVGREAILKVHLKSLKLSDNISVKNLAAQTPGFAGADLANICNEASLIAARRNKKAVEMQDFFDAIDRIIGGLEKKNKIISPEEKKIVAYHEAGHAVTGWFLEHVDPLVKVSIVPRGVAALGYAQYLPKEQFLYQTDQMIDEMVMAMGGRASEEIIFQKISTGALSDLERVTKMAYGIVTIYGMNDKIGNVSFYDSKQSEPLFNKPYSESTAETIDAEVRKIIADVYERSKSLLILHKDKLEIIAQELLQKEILFQNDLERLIGPRPFEKPTAYQSFIQTEQKADTKLSNEKDINVLNTEDTNPKKKKTKNSLS